MAPVRCLRLALLAAGTLASAAAGASFSWSTPTTSEASSFVLASTKVTNPNAPELTVDAAGGTAVDDHTGPYGGAGNGGSWKVRYTFTVPRTLTAGKSAAVPVGIQMSDVDPVQPLGIQMTVRAYDFAQPYSIHYPEQAAGSHTFTIPISASYNDYKDLFIIVSVVSAEITYTYHRVAQSVATSRAAKARAAVAWAREQLGSGAWAGKCEAFVERAYGAPRGSGFRTALAAANALDLHKTAIANAPAGAILFFDPSRNCVRAPARYGHAGLSIGGGKMIDAEGAVVVTDAARSASWRKAYLGWAYPRASWPGR
jgi:cell wall-associated NlpC family hydrolase